MCRRRKEEEERKIREEKLDFGVTVEDAVLQSGDRSFGNL